MAHLSGLRPDHYAELPVKVQALVSDFDGVFTDDLVHVSSDGVESVTCSRADGLGIELLREAGLPMLVISRETNVVVELRCRKLQLPCETGIREKWPTLRAWLHERGLSASGVVYVGNDVTDVECLANVGCGVAPADARAEALEAAKIVLESPGGRGAIREICDLILARISTSTDSSS